MTSTTSRSKPVPIPISIPSNSSNDASSSSESDEDNPNFVGTPYHFDRFNPYEYPFPPPSTSTPPAAAAPPSNGTRPTPSSAALPLSATAPTLSFLFSHSTLASNIATPPSNPPPTQPPPSPRRRLHSRLPSLIAMGLKLDVPAPIPPNLIGKSLGTLSPALGLEPGEVLTSEKASMLGWRERLYRPTVHPDPSLKRPDFNGERRRGGKKKFTQRENRQS